MNGYGNSSKKPFAKRSLGQNFLIDGNYIRKIVDALGDIRSCHVIEIGPGRGALTELLSKNAGLLTAIELDTVFAEDLKKRYKSIKSTRVLEADILKADIQSIAEWGGLEDIRFVANLPYNISTPVLRLLSGFSSVFTSALLMLQKEVVNRIIAKPGDRNRGYLTVLTEAYFTAERLFEVPPTAFRPVPKVTSAVVRLTPKTDLLEVTSKDLKRVLSTGFSQKRKTIANNLKGISEFKDPKSMLKSMGLDPGLRPEALELCDWVLLAGKLSKI